MKKATFITLGIIYILTSFSLLAKPSGKESNVQLAILLDTSNSMDGLIDQAKSQLWKIVNELARSRKHGEPINLRVALYEYGNDGLPAEEGYLRQVTRLTNDLDKISEELFRLRTNGGSEFCGTAINSAVRYLNWSEDRGDLKMIVIAGNEPFTQGSIDYRNACERAAKNGVTVNTIFCGNYSEGVNTGWKDGAMITGGTYMNIDQNERIVHIDTPYDDELIRLGKAINSTYIAYGKKGEELKERQEMQDNNSMSLSPAVMAQRSAAKASGQYKNTEWDLVDADSEEEIDLEKIDKKLLPDELQNKSGEELKRYVDEMKSKRTEIQTKINELNEKRRKHIAEKSLEHQDNTFDSAMLKAIRDQAEKKGFEFKD
ncbi:MAG: VWA domain-containing protein [Bacteroidetes bacterium]|nr:VWA domain-containing protein [Bacteroidota bacterium]